MCAMLSLIIDIGYGRVAQGQMQNAADTAAIEGIRQRDTGVSEANRRAAVSNVVGWVFDEDYDPTDGDADYQFGAGPIIDLTEGATSLHGLQTASVPDIHVYKPNLQANLDNAPEGDMVRGQFCYNADPVRSEDVAYEMQDTVCGQPQRGAGAYARNDFNPGGANPNAFLVRLRRSNEYQDLEGRTDPDVGSSGPSLPLTFGKATTIHGDDPAATHWVRRCGLTVRATAIAETRPALHIGFQPPGQLAPFVLLDTCLQSPAGAQPTVQVTIDQMSGVIRRNNVPPAVSECGRFISLLTPPIQVPPAIRSVGAPLPLGVIPVQCQLVLPPNATPYVAVYAQMSTGPNRIIGFARARLNRVGGCFGPTFQAMIVRLPSAVVPFNAPAMLPNGFAGGPPPLITGLRGKNLAAHHG